MNLRATILKADMPHEIVKVPVQEWGCDVYVRTITAGELDQLELANVETENKMFRAMYCCAAVCDENGDRLFTFDDAESLSKKSAKVINRLFAKIVELNRIEKKDVEEHEKNSTAVPSDGSSSDSLPT